MRQPTMHPGGWGMNLKYDGILGYEDAPPGVWLSPTLYHGNYPTTSPYPTGGTPGQGYWRVFVSMNYLQLYDDNEWRLFYIHETKTGFKNTAQVLAFVPNGYFKLLPFQNAYQLDKKNNPYLCYMEIIDPVSGATHIQWMCPKPPIWTKVFINSDIVLSNPPATMWDRVTKSFGV